MDCAPTVEASIARCRPAPKADPFYCTKPFTMAWRSVLLPAKCFTHTVSLGWHHLTSVSRREMIPKDKFARRPSWTPKTSTMASLRAETCAGLHGQAVPNWPEYPVSRYARGHKPILEGSEMRAQSPEFHATPFRLPHKSGNSHFLPRS